MNLAVHQQYQLRNTATRQTARFEVLELYLYKGQYILYGERMRQGIWMPSRFGHVQAPPGPCCFPLFPIERQEDIEQLVTTLRSLPLYLIAEEGEAFPVLSLEDAVLVLGGRKGDREDMIRRSQQLIDLYLEWKTTKALPSWFWLKQQAVKARN